MRASLQSPCTTTVLWPERFRGGCAFGTEAFAPDSPVVVTTLLCDGNRLGKRCDALAVNSDFRRSLRRLADHAGRDDLHALEGLRTKLLDEKFRAALERARENDE